MSGRSVGMVPDHASHPLLYSRNALGMPGAVERFLQARRQLQWPVLLIDRACRQRRQRLGRNSLLDRRFARNVRIAVHDVVRINEARHHEERLAALARVTGILAQPPDSLAGDKRIVVKPGLGATADVPTGVEDIEAVRLNRLAVIDRRLYLEDRFVHFELAEIGRPVSEPLQDGAHVGKLGVERRRKSVFHLIEDVMNLRWLAGEKRRARGRTHRRGDIVVVEGHAAARDGVDSGQRIFAFGEQPVAPLVADHEQDVVGRLTDRGAGRLLFLCASERAANKHQQAHACQ